MMQFDPVANGQHLSRLFDCCVAVGKTITRFGNSFQIFESDKNFQYSIAFAIWQIRGLSGELPPEYCKATEDRVRWEQIKVLGNRILHDYDNVDKADIWQTATTDIPTLKAFCEEELAKARQESR